MILAIVFAVLAFQRAKASGRNAWLWAFIAVGVYIGVQLLVGMAAGMVILVGVMTMGWSETAVVDYELPINIVSIVVAVVTSWLLLKYLDRIPDEQPMTMPPPPPANFDREA